MLTMKKSTLVTIIVLALLGGTGVGVVLAFQVDDERGQAVASARPQHPHKKAPTSTPTPSPSRTTRVTPPPTPTPSPSRSTPAPEPTATPPHQVEPYTEAFAIYPNDTPEDAASACSGAGARWRDDPVAVALAFAGDQLGWQEARSAGSEGAAGSTYVTVKQGPHAQVTVELVGGYPRSPHGYPTDSCYSVVAVHPADPSQEFMSISITRAAAHLGFPTMGADSIDVTVAHGKDEVATTVGGGAASLALPAPPDRPGFVLVVYRDRSGAAFTAQGSAIPAGSFAAG